MTSCKFFKRTATHVTSATLEETSVEMDEVSWEDCEGRNGVVSFTGRSPIDFSSDRDLELRWCGVCSPPLAGNVQIEHDILHQRLHLHSSRVPPRDPLCGVCVDSWERWRMDSERISSDFETVLMQSCQSLSTPTSVIVSPFLDWDLLKVVDADERQKSEMRKCFIERAPNSSSDGADVAFAVPERTLVLDNLNSSCLEDIFTTAEHHTVTVTTPDIVSASSNATLYHSILLPRVQYKPSINPKCGAA
ncbi:hypothetical protein BLNAU_3256 [Blattamonas nauphoetae]|uniref:Uncharacterized protein n=1 Tax=Blattamonas nauphoetae TaxID=2049346 RepID=A0ABQ9YE03_9EUKA|nr:hypothetical protein BLNAU_3256 [Blattamonas nauphoetae]